MEVSNNLSIIPYEEALPPEIRQHICSFLSTKELLAFRECAHFTNADVIAVKREHVFKEKRPDSETLKKLLKIFPQIFHLEFFQRSLEKFRNLVIPNDLLKNKEAIKKLTFTEKKLTLTEQAELGPSRWALDVVVILQALRNFPKVQELRFNADVREQGDITMRGPFNFETSLDNLIYRFIQEGIIPVDPSHTVETLDKINKFRINNSDLMWADTTIGSGFASLRKYLETQEEFADLKIIDLSGNKSSHDENSDYAFLESVYYTLTTKSPNLETLILNDCGDYCNSSVIIFETFLINFPECSKLQNLHLRNTEVKDEHLERIAKKCPQLKFLDLRGCKSITIDGIKTLQSHYKENPITIEHDLETNKD